jgi:5-enolpyruvylshikimate-3-phosphate synthase
MGCKERETKIKKDFSSKAYILLIDIISIGMTGIRKKKLKSRKYKLTKKELHSLNWGEIEKRLGIDSSEEPPKKIKMKIMQDSVFARECEWFSNKDIKNWLKKGDKILESFHRTFREAP